MSGRPAPKPEENLKDKFIGFFRRNKPTVQNVPKPTAKDFIITPQILKVSHTVSTLSDEKMLLLVTLF